MNKLIKTAMMLFVLATAPCHAQWYETEGTAQIRNGDTATARTQATDEAIRQAMLESGSFVSTSQSMSDGIYGEDSFNIASNNSIKQYSLISERRHNGFLTVKIRVFMEDQPQTCTGSAFKKSIMPVLFVYGDNQFQASEGGLRGINTWLTTGFTAELKNNPTGITAPYYNRNLGLDPAKVTPGKNKLNDTIKHLAREYDVQYISIGVIRDLSKHKDDSGWISKTFGDDLREISFDVYVYDGLTAQEVLHSSYHDTAAWNIKGEADLYSDYFKNSAYGFAVSRLLKKAAAEVSSTVACLKPVGRIIRTDDNGGIYINLGRRNNIRQGARFYIEHSSIFRDADGITRHDATRANGIYTVVRVFDNTAVLQTTGLPDGNIQPDDLAIAE